MALAWFAIRRRKRQVRLAAGMIALFNDQGRATGYSLLYPNLDTRPLVIDFSGYR